MTMTAKTLLRRATCQICAREQALSNDTQIVLHGYRRPGDGYTVGRCLGVGAAPFELSREVLRSYIKSVRAEQRHTERKGMDWRSGKADGAVFAYTKYGPGTQKSTAHVTVFQADFAGDGAEAARKLDEAHVLRYEERSWAVIAERFAQQCDQQARFLADHADDQQRRFNAWTLAPERIKPAVTTERAPLTATQRKLLERIVSARERGLAVVFLKNWSSSWKQRATEWELVRRIPASLLTIGEAPEAEARRGTFRVSAFRVTPEGLAALKQQ